MGFLILLVGFGLGTCFGCWVCGGLVVTDDPEEQSEWPGEEGHYHYAPERFPMH